MLCFTPSFYANHVCGAHSLSLTLHKFKSERKRGKKNKKKKGKMCTWYERVREGKESNPFWSMTEGYKLPVILFYVFSLFFLFLLLFHERNEGRYTDTDTKGSLCLNCSLNIHFCMKIAKNYGGVESSVVEKVGYRASSSIRNVHIKYA